MLVGLLLWVDVFIGVFLLEVSVKVMFVLCVEMDWILCGIVIFFLYLFSEDDDVCLVVVCMVCVFGLELMLYFFVWCVELCVVFECFLECVVGDVGVECCLLIVGDLVMFVGLFVDSVLIIQIGFLE